MDGRQDINRKQAMLKRREENMDEEEKEQDGSTGSVKWPQSCLNHAAFFGKVEG